jgi:hypothetical protein
LPAKGTKKSGLSGRFSSKFYQLTCRDGIYRAGIGARSAIGAGIGVDNELVIALTDRFHRAGGLARTAGNALAGNYIGHGLLLLLGWLYGYWLKRAEYTSKNLDYIINYAP